MINIGNYGDIIHNKLWQNVIQKAWVCRQHASYNIVDQVNILIRNKLEIKLGRRLNIK